MNIRQLCIKSMLRSLWRNFRHQPMHEHTSTSFGWWVGRNVETADGLWMMKHQPTWMIGIKRSWVQTRGRPACESCHYLRAGTISCLDTCSSAGALPSRTLRPRSASELFAPPALPDARHAQWPPTWQHSIIKGQLSLPSLQSKLNTGLSGWD